MGLFIDDQTGIFAVTAADAGLIGILLIVFTIALGWENKRRFLGETLPDQYEAPLLELGAASSDIECVLECTSRCISDQIRCLWPQMLDLD